MIFRQLFDLTSSTYTYLLACEKTKQAILIDPVFELVRRDIALLKELGLTLTATLETHCHADHVTAGWLLKQKLASKIGSAAVIQATDVDLKLSDGDVVEFGNESVTVLATPGHTDGCLSFLTADKSRVFTGDALLIRGCGRCDFQQGDAQSLFESVHDKLFNLPENCSVYPGHDYTGKTMSTVIEEKKFNPRLGGGASVNDFKGYMNAMKLPHPKLIDYAVPANLSSGKPDNDYVENIEQWAPINLTFSGVPEIDVDWVCSHKNDVTILDVRESFELESESERISGAVQIPLVSLHERAQELDVSKPIVCVCRSGSRSALAVGILKKSGFEKVANVAGGVIRWKETNAL